MAYAVRFLNVLYRRTGSWPKSIAAYHSETPQIADDYQRRVLATWQQHVGRQPGGLQHGGQQPGGAPATGDPIYVDSGLIYGAFGSTGRVYGLILQGN